jgi:hypothetical protein
MENRINRQMNGDPMIKKNLAKCEAHYQEQRYKSNRAAICYAQLPIFNQRSKSINSSRFAATLYQRVFYKLIKGKK